MKKILILTLALAGGVWGQTQWVPCFLTNPGSFPVYFTVSTASPFVQCEQISLDTSVITARNTNGTVIVSAISGAPAHSYKTVLQWPFITSNSVWTDPSGTPSPFAAQPVWCSSTSAAGIQTFVSQLGAFLPTMLIEFRQAGTATPVLTTSGLLSAQAITNGGRYLWVQSAPQCGGNPGLVFSSGAGSIVVGNTTTQSTLISVTIVGII